MKISGLAVFLVIFLSSCGGGSNSSGGLFGPGGVVWPGPTSEFDAWINRDLRCGQFTMVLTGSSMEARPPNDPSYTENTYWVSQNLNGDKRDEGIWYTSRADEFTESSLTLSGNTFSTWKIVMGNLESDRGVQCTPI